MFGTWPAQYSFPLHLFFQSQTLIFLWGTPSLTLSPEAPMGWALPYLIEGLGRPSLGALAS